MRKAAYLLLLAALLPLGARAQKVDVGRLFATLSRYHNVYASDGWVTVWDTAGHCGLVDARGREVLPCEYDFIFTHVPGSIIAEKDSTVLFYNTRGRKVAHHKGTLVWEREASEEPLLGDLIPVVAADGRIAVADKRGRMVQPFRYSDVWEAAKGKFGVRRGDTVALLDSKGRECFSLTGYEYLWPLPDGLYSVGKNDKEGVVDAQGREVLPCSYWYVLYESDGLCLYARDTNRRERAFATDGTPLLQGGYAYIGCLTPTRFCVLRSMDDSVSDMVDQRGNVIATGDFRYVRNQQGWLVADGIGDKSRLVGVIDTLGRWLIEPQYRHLQVVDADRAIVGVNDSLVCVIDRQGRHLAEYNRMDYSLGCACHPETVAYIAARRGDRWGFLDSTLHEVIPPRYAYAQPAPDDRLWVFFDDSTTALVDPTGRELVRAEGYIYELLPGVYKVGYWERDDMSTRFYLIASDGRTTATAEQRRKNRESTRRDFESYVRKR